MGWSHFARRWVREIRPRQPSFELRFETPAGRQAQVAFAYFEVVFDDAPTERRIVWLFALVLGHSRYLWARYVVHQDLVSVLRCHMAAFEHLGGVPKEFVDIRNPPAQSRLHWQLPARCV